MGLIEDAEAALGNARRRDLFTSRKLASEALQTVLKRAISYSALEPTRLGTYTVTIDGLHFEVKADNAVEVSGETFAATKIEDLVSLGLVLERAGL